MLLTVDSLRFLDWAPITLQVSVGETLAVVGESGSGKSLFLRALADLIPHEGDCALDGVSMTAMTAARWRRQVGLLSSESLWWEDLVKEHFEGPVSDERLAALGLDRECLDWEVGRLSMGERQRIGLLRLLAREPRVLLLDEPTASLDAGLVWKSETLVADYLRERSAAAIWVTHDGAQASRLGRRIFEMSDKRLSVGAAS